MESIMESMYRSKSGRKSVSMRSFHELQIQVHNLSVRLAEMEKAIAQNEEEKKPVSKPKAKKEEKK
jgi:hypothetical protein